MATKRNLPVRKARPSNAAKFGEIGNAGLRQNYGFVYEEFVQRLSGLRGVQFYREMYMNDPVIFAMMFGMERILAQTSWQIIPGGESPEDLAAAEFIKTCMMDMSHTWGEFITNVLTFLRYGWAYFEIVYKIRRGPDGDPTTRSEYSDGLIGWRKFALRPQSTLFNWTFDDSGGIQGMTQLVTFTGFKAFIPIDRAMLFRTTTEKNNPEGLSLLRACAKPYSYKKAYEEIEGVSLERDLVGYPTIQPPEDFDINDVDNATAVQWAKDFITGVKNDEQKGALIPPGWKFEIMGSPGKRQFDMGEVITRIDKRMTMSLLMPWLMLGMERTGSYAQSKNQTDVFFLALCGWGDLIADVINRFAINPLLRMNPKFSGLKTKPQLAPARIGMPDLDTIANYVNKLAKVGGFENDAQSQEYFRQLIRIKEAPDSRDISIKGKEQSPAPVVQPTPKGRKAPVVPPQSTAVSGT
jgi:hypothetical protein